MWHWQKLSSECNYFTINYFYFRHCQCFQRKNIILHLKNVLLVYSLVEKLTKFQFIVWHQLFIQISFRTLYMLAECFVFGIQIDYFIDGVLYNQLAEWAP